MYLIGEDALAHPEFGMIDLADQRWVERMRPQISANGRRLAANATLRENEWKMLDDAVTQPLYERLTVVDDFRSRGLVEPISEGTIIRRTERVREFEDAEIHFDGATRVNRDKVNYEADEIGVPIISKDFVIGFRQLSASRTKGEALDTTSAMLAGRKVRDQVENLITNGLSTGTPVGSSIPGLTSAGSRRTVTLSDQWDGAGNVDEIIPDIEAMLAEAYSVNLFGPFVVYVPKNYWAIIQADYQTSGGATINRTVMQRILQYEDIVAVRPNDKLADDNVVMVQMTKDCMDLSVARDVVTVQWNVDPFEVQFRVFFIGGPQIKTRENDADGTTIHGIVHLS